MYQTGLENGCTPATAPRTGVVIANRHRHQSPRKRMTASHTSDLDTPTFVLSVLDRIESNGHPPEMVDEAFQLLADRRRRLTLAVVRDHAEALTLPDVADEVAVREYDRPLSEISGETVAEVYTSIYHDHLPRLVEVGLLEYDQQRDLVAPDF